MCPTSEATIKSQLSMYVFQLWAPAPKKHGHCFPIRPLWKVVSLFVHLCFPIRPLGLWLIPCSEYFHTSCLKHGRSILCLPGIISNKQITLLRYPYCLFVWFCVILCDCLLGRSKHQTMSWVKSCGSWSLSLEVCFWGVCFFQFLKYNTYNLAGVFFKSRTFLWVGFIAPPPPNSNSAHFWLFHLHLLY